MRALWGITTFFNPTRSQLRIDNYRRFRAASAKQGMPLVAVELAFGDDAFELEPGVDAEILVQRRSTSVLWQKERLLNLGLAALPRECTGVCWIDADVLFDDDDWVEACNALLREHVVIQPFSAVVRLPERGEPAEFPAAELGRSIPEGTDDATYCMSLCSRLDRLFSSFGAGGTTGYAWCAQRAVLDELGFYDRCIVGGGDREFALACLYARPPKRRLKIHHVRLREHMRTWQADIYARVGKRIGHRPGVIHHLWHGAAGQRNYVDRHAILIEHDFDPERDIALDEGGCWAWTGANPGLEQAVWDYFESRRDDGS